MTKSKFLAGVAFGAAGIIYTAVDAPVTAWPYLKSKLPDAISMVVESALSMIGETPTLPGTWYVHVFYKGSPDGKPIETWSVSGTGRTTLEGSVVDLATDNRGVASGYVRANTITLSYASKDPARPGYGTYVLKQVQPHAAAEPVIYVGASIIHNCQQTTEKSNGGEPPAQVSTNECRGGPVLSCPAVLSPRRVLNAEITTRYFKEPCTQLPVTWPETVISDANARTKRS